MITGYHRSPDVIERGKAQVLSLAIYSDTGTQTVAGGTLTLYDPQNNVVLSAVSVTASTNSASYTLGLTTLNDYDFGEGWREEWALTLGSGEICIFRRPAILARRQFYPTLIPSDLSDLHSELPQVATYTIDGTETTWDVFAWRKLDSCWNQLIRWLCQNNRLPNKIASISLYDLHLAMTLEAIFRDLRGQKGDRYDSTLADYTGKAERLRATATLSYDSDEDGSFESKVAPTPTFSISSGPRLRSAYPGSWGVR